MPYLRGVNDPYDYYGTLHNWGPLYRASSQLAGQLGAAVDGSLRSIYTVVRGTSPRIVKAAIIGSKGITFMDGNMLRMKANLDSTWAIFRSMSITPAPADHASIGVGGGVTLAGRVYPALAGGSRVTLNSYYGGKWHSRSVTTTPYPRTLVRASKPPTPPTARP